MSTNAPRVRLRQAVLAAGELEPVAQELRSTLGLQEPFHDPGVGMFGLRNAVFALGEARAAWERLGRPLDVVRCEMLLGRRLREHDPRAAAAVLARVATAYEELGIEHLAEQSRELLPVS